ncbi:hypothetical protein PROFUN_13962 [Planoprotostelium fungivorum]|uniref:ZZ-type domain-containing protein n=1 Tax=Planoprotostelium fungivorum TaxID=1890364 RepID=A0A2P6N2M6_9EUKA|nr:hypothetical protein PROFUN_13962 [Planoprotostelium fungivorum]
MPGSKSKITPPEVEKPEDMDSDEWNYYQCDHCDNFMKEGMDIFHCLQCKDFDLCADCFKNRFQRVSARRAQKKEKQVIQMTPNKCT